jgi:hypothetical protein
MKRIGRIRWAIAFLGLATMATAACGDPSTIGNRVVDGDGAIITDLPMTPDSGIPEPDSSMPEPDTSMPEPDTSTPEPDTSMPEPDTSTPEPDTSLPEPDTAMPEPDTSLPEPDTNLPEDDMLPDATDDATPALPPTHMKRVFIKNANSRNAVCNDGSRAAYYARPGTGSKASRWIIHLKGGSHCRTIADCQQRWNNDQNLMSSNAYPAYKNHGGIFSPDPSINPDFYDWTHVYVYYCSSDSWAGEQTASAATGNWHFRGKSIFTALIEDLKGLPGDLSLDNATGVLLTGSSAGSEGVLNNVDYLATLIPGVTLRGVIDSNTGSYIDPVVPKNPAAQLGIANQKVDFWNPTLDESCVQTTGSRVDCLLTDDQPSFIQTSLFVYLDQKDSLAVSKYNGDPALLAAHALAVRQVLQPLPGAFSTRKGFHTALTSTTRFHNTKVAGSNFATVLANWVLNRPGPKNVIKP